MPLVVVVVGICTYSSICWCGGGSRYMQRRPVVYWAALLPCKRADPGSIPGRGENFGQVFFTPTASVYPAVIGNLDVNRLADCILG